MPRGSLAGALVDAIHALVTAADHSPRTAACLESIINELQAMSFEEIEALREVLQARLTEETGAFARPELIHFYGRFLQDLKEGAIWRA